MLEQLFNLIKGHANSEIIENPEVPNQHNNQAVGLATESIFSGLQGALANGGLQQILSLFSGQSNTGSSNPLVSGIINNLAGNLIGKLGVNNGAAAGIAQSLIPNILSKLVHTTSDPNNNSMDMNGIISALTGGNHAPAQQANGGFDFNSILSKLTGGQAVQPTANAPASNQSGLNIADILSQFTGGGNAQQAQQQSGGGLQDLLNKLTQGASQGQQQQQQSGGGVMDLLKGLIGG